MSPTTRRKKPPVRRKKASRSRSLAPRAVVGKIDWETLKKLIPYLGKYVATLPKVINVDWEDNDPHTDNPVPNPMTMGLYVGDYVVWRNFTDVDLTIEFTSDWPFEGTMEDISLPHGEDSTAYKVVEAKGTWTYNFKSPYGGGGPGGPGVTVPGG